MPGDEDWASVSPATSSNIPFTTQTWKCSELTHPLGIIARARGMTEMASASGIGRESLYKALRPNAQTRFDTIATVCAALGVKLVAQLAHAAPIDSS